MIDYSPIKCWRVPTAFDRMIAQVERQAAERAWDEGFAAGLNFDSDNYTFTNPYRESETRND